MTEPELTWLRELLHRRSGLSLTAEKRYLVDSRLSAVCRQHGIASMSDLIGKVRAGSEPLTVAVVEAMTTNETLFFRDTLPFTHFKGLMLPHLLKARASERTLRIWCAASSSGQEPYSLAMILDDMAAEISGWRIEITATDISNDILERAREGVYSQFEVQRGLPIASLLKHFTQQGDRWRISEKLRRMVTFRQHNLISPQGHLGTFDMIFCRNVLIYFDMPTKSKVLATLAQQLRPDGFLLLGAAETVVGLTAAFSVDRDNRGVYRPVDAAARLEAKRVSPADISNPAVRRGSFPAPAEPRTVPLSVVGGTRWRG